jgi:hypothetical protein
MKKTLIVVLVAIVVVLVVAVGYVARNKDKIVDMALDKGLGTMESVVLKYRPDSVPADSVRAVFDTTLERIKNGDVAAYKVQSVMLYFRESMEDKQLDSLEVMRILDEMKDL